MGWQVSSFNTDEIELPFCYNGVFGYSSYDTIEFVEDLQLQQDEKEHKSIPLTIFSVYRYVLVFDQYSNELHLIENNINEDGWSLEQCYPSDLPWYTYQGNDYIFTRK